ncbi:protocadherin gamma-A5-like, partial [Phasianus colchicus]|uniref:protocadherin gamma-A5-like n=1 Tax=Phasianus colchicus TaxID=9054 RepID=UPI00129D7998
MCLAREGRWGRRQRALLCCVLLAAWEAAWGQLRYSVPEELPKASFVGDVAKDLALELAALGARGARVVSQGRAQYFALHASSGHLVTAERIDREQLCESESECVLRCELIVEGEMKVYAIEVEITDINDNAPSFREGVIELKMNEVTAPGSRLLVPEAHDPDVGVNSLQSYALSGDEHFSLSVQAGANGEKRPELVLAKALDREEAAFHELLLRASDGGEPARTGTARIRVAVLDANDNAPAFSQAVYTVRVPEDVPVGSTLLSVTATDPDDGTNGDVKYSLNKITQKASKIFHLEQDTGAIKLVRNLDFEEWNSYELELQNREKRNAREYYEIAEGVQRAAVVRWRRFLRQRQRRRSVEPCVQCRALAAGAAVHRGGEEGAERCRQPRPLRPGSLARSVSVSPSGRAASGPAVQSGAAVRRRGGGRGVGGAVREMCLAREGRWGRRQRALLCCVLVAAWEAAWGQLRYSVPEELPKGSFVGDVAKDLALELSALGARGARVVSQGRAQYFALHASSGHLVTAERIDREQLCESKPQCVLRCELIVEGEMKVYAIEVEITDINDNAPSFKELQVEERMNEMTAPGTRFPLSKAYDPDVGVNSLQSYELSGDEHFSLSVQAGADGEKRPELVLAKALDREEAAFHELLLRASDGGEPARTGTARIRVAVLDANDNAPAFSQAVYTVRVPEDVPVGSTLLSVTATDPDDGTNGDVKYSIKIATEMALEIFHLETDTGAIRLVTNLDYEKGDSYEILVQAHDGGALSDTAKVSIS